jgi:chromosome segregation ATPase
MKRGLMVIGWLLVVGAGEIAAQQGPQRRARMGMEIRGSEVEAILRLRDRLELTEDQVARLDEVRRESVARRSEQMARMAELRSQLAAGQVRRSELMAAMEEHQDANRAFAQERQEFVDGLLTEAQRATLDELRPRGRQLRARGRWMPQRGAFRGPRAAPFRGRVRMWQRAE